MNNFRQLLILVIGFVFLCISSHTFASKPVVKIGILEFPPFSYLEKDGETLTGSIVKLTRKVFITAGYDVEFITLPFARSVAAAEAGEIDVCGMLNATTSNKLQLSAQSVGQLLQTFYVRASDDWHFNGVDSLTGRSVLNVASYSYTSISPEYQHFLENVVNIGSTPGYHERIITMIDTNRADVFNEAKDVMEHQLKILDASNKLKSAGTLGEPLQLFIGAKPGPEGAKIRDDFDKALKVLRENGEA